MADRENSFFKWLEVAASLTMLGGMLAAGVGMLLGSVSILAGAFLAAVAPAQIALWECRRNRENGQSCDVEPEEGGGCLHAAAIETDEGRRFQERVSKPAAAGRRR